MRKCDTDEKVVVVLYCSASLCCYCASRQILGKIHGRKIKNDPSLSRSIPNLAMLPMLPMPTQPFLATCWAQHTETHGQARNHTFTSSMTSFIESLRAAVAGAPACEVRAERLVERLVEQQRALHALHQAAQAFQTAASTWTALAIPVKTVEEEGDALRRRAHACDDLCTAALSVGFNGRYERARASAQYTLSILRQVGPLAGPLAGAVEGSMLESICAAARTLPSLDLPSLATPSSDAKEGVEGVDTEESAAVHAAADLLLQADGLLQILEKQERRQRHDSLASTVSDTSVASATLEPCDAPRGKPCPDASRLSGHKRRRPNAVAVAVADGASNEGCGAACKRRHP